MQSARRTFLKVGIAGAVMLPAAGCQSESQGQTTLKRFVLADEAKAAIDAIVPVMLDQMVPTEALTRAAAISATTERVHQAILGLPLATQEEVQDLFRLLTFGLTRRFLAGVSSDWSRANPEQVVAFLQGWRFHRFALLQNAYYALHDLVIGSWYADPANWSAIGYPGPIKELS